MNPIIIALDCETAAEARRIVDATAETVDYYKVGLELYAVSGMEVVNELLGRGKKVFLDLKLHDIGETVKRATAAIAKSGVSLLTVHAEPQVMRAAVAGRGSSDLRILAVTVLTSLDQMDVQEMGYTCTMRELFDLRVRSAVRAGVDGLVCSPLEVGEVRRTVGPEKLLVTPGVRSAGAAKGDQKRVATPAEAMADGASHLVIGRQVTRAADPNQAVREILAELSAT
ncbi:MAG TPA: orotidine-5'-phosphate decarboxylase [Bryobacteraceae bacterium]|nr:orotidine-5'-phosphate decarboxylase [Bryobacteraceae bacterium]